MFRWVGRLLSLVPLSAAMIMRAFGMHEQALAATKLAYRLGRSARLATQILGQMRGQGLAAARAQADAWLAEGPTAPVAALAGLLALDQGGLTAAEEYLDLAKRSGPDRDGITDVLEVAVAMARGTPAVVELMQSFGQRRDLPAAASREILRNQMWLDLMQGQWEQARPLAERLLEVEENLQARCVMAGLAKRDRDPKAAAGHAAAMSTAPAAQRMYCQSWVAYATGDNTEGERLLDELWKVDPRRADRLKQELQRWGRL